MTDPGGTFSRDFRFWIGIMQEHTLFIRMGIPNNRPDLIAEAQRFVDLFTRLRQAAQAGPIHRNLVMEVREATLALLGFKRRLLAMAIQCEILSGSNLPLLLDHIAREAVEFLQLIDRRPLASAGRFAAILEKEVFWLKIMGDHAKFIHHLLDPSERELLNTAAKFSAEFDQLFLQAWELRSMTQARPAEFFTVDRFTELVIEKTSNLRDFKVQSRELIAACRLLGLIPEELAAHVAREAEYFITILKEM